MTWLNVKTYWGPGAVQPWWNIDIVKNYNMFGVGWLSGRMLDSQSKHGHFRYLHDAPVHSAVYTVKMYNMCRAGWLSGRTLDSQSKLGHFRYLHDAPVHSAVYTMKMYNMCRAGWLSGRTLDSQSKLGHFRISTMPQFTQLYKQWRCIICVERGDSAVERWTLNRSLGIFISPRCPSSLSCIDESTCTWL